MTSAVEKSLHLLMVGDGDGVIVTSRVRLIAVTMVLAMVEEVVVAMVVTVSPSSHLSGQAPPPGTSNCQVPPTEYSKFLNCWTLLPSTL